MTIKAFFRPSRLLLALAGLLVVFAVSYFRTGSIEANVENASPWPKVTVYKSATCGCCRAWVAYLRQKGFVVEVHNEEDMGRIKQEFGIPAPVQSCHTARIGDLLVEGHVTAATIIRALNDKAVALVAVPGMPYGSPGMGGFVHPFDEVAVDSEGQVSVYNRVASRDQI